MARRRRSLALPLLLVASCSAPSVSPLLVPQLDGAGGLDRSSCSSGPDVAVEKETAEKDIGERALRLRRP